MRRYSVTDLPRIKDIQNFARRNLESVSVSVADIISVVTQLRSRVASAEASISNDAIRAYTTTLRPTSTANLNTIIINTTTNKLNHTIDGGTTWYNADGTAA